MSLDGSCLRLAEAFREVFVEAVKPLHKKLDGIEAKMDGIEAKMDGIEAKMDKKLDGMEKSFGVCCKAIREDVKKAFSEHIKRKT